MMTGFTTHGLESTAKALAKKHNITVLTGTGRLCTDGRTIYLPTIPPHLGDYQMTSVIRGWIDHEVGHIVGDSDFKAKEAMTKRYGKPGGDVINALEDIRVNQLMRKWAGCAWNIDSLYRWAYAGRVGGTTKSLANKVSLELTRRAELPQSSPTAWRDKAAVAEICDEYESEFGPAGDCVNAGVTRELVSHARWLCRRLGLLPDTPHSDSRKRDREGAADALTEAQDASDKATETHQKGIKEASDTDRAQVAQREKRDTAQELVDVNASQTATADLAEQQRLLDEAVQDNDKKREARRKAIGDKQSAVEALCAAADAKHEIDKQAKRAGIDACEEQSASMARKIMRHLKAEANQNPPAQQGADSGMFSDIHPDLDKCKRFDKDDLEPGSISECISKSRYFPDISNTPAAFVDLVRSTAPRLTHQLRQWLLSEPKHGWQTDQRRGMLDTRRIAELATGITDRVMKRRIEVKAPDTACYLMLDGSWSMGSGAMAADRNIRRLSHFSAVAAGVFADVISSARHALEIGVFIGSTMAGKTKKECLLPEDERISRAIKRNPAARYYGAEIRQLKAWQEPMRLAWPNLAAAQAIACGGTPLDGAIKYATGALLARAESRKILLCFTDGEPGNERRAKWQCQQTAAAGIDLLLVGINESSVRRLHDRTIVVDEPAKLSEQLLLGFESIIKSDRRELRKAV